jgi:hypothetical protein
LDVLVRLANIDNCLVGLYQELELARVISTIEGNLHQRMWTITYNGEGHWVAEVGTGTWEYNERTGIAKCVRDSIHARAEVPNPQEVAPGV